MPRQVHPTLQTSTVFCILNHLRGTRTALPPLQRRSVETYRLSAAGAASAPPGTRRQTAGRSLALPSQREGAGIANAGGTDPGPRVLGRRVKTIKGATESEREEGWRKGDGCRASPPPAHLYSLGLWSGPRRGWVGGEELGDDAPQISLPVRALTRARPPRPPKLQRLGRE